MLDEGDPLSQLGSQWDGNEQGEQSASQGAQPSIRSSPWNTQARQETVGWMHTVPENGPRTQSHTYDQPALTKALGGSGVNSRTEKRFKV